MADASHIRSTIKARRQELRISQDIMGAVLGITGVSYGRLENGRSEFSVSQLQKVCEKLGLDFEDLSNKLPMQAKTAPVPVTEYSKVVNELMDVQRKYVALTENYHQQHRDRITLENVFQSYPILKDAFEFLRSAKPEEAQVFTEAVKAMLPDTAEENSKKKAT